MVNNLYFGVKDIVARMNQYRKDGRITEKMVRRWICSGIISAWKIGDDGTVLTICQVQKNDKRPWCYSEQAYLRDLEKIEPNLAPK